MILLALAGPLLDLLEEESVLLSELRAESLVEHLDDRGQRRFVVLRLPRSDFRRALDVLSLAFLHHDCAREHALQPVVLERHLITHLDDRRVTIER